MNFAWSVVLSALVGIGVGAFWAYIAHGFLEKKANAYLVVGIVVLSLPFTVYFSMEKDLPFLTLLFYFLPACGTVFAFIGSIINEEKEDDEVTKLTERSRTVVDYKSQEEVLKAEMSLDDLLAEKARREAAKEYKSHVKSLSDEDLNKRISELRKINRS